MKSRVLIQSSFNIHIIHHRKGGNKTKSIIKSESDKRLYRAVTLSSNQLRMTLISDPKTEESGKCIILFT